MAKNEVWAEFRTNMKKKTMAAAAAGQGNTVTAVIVAPATMFCARGSEVVRRANNEFEYQSQWMYLCK